jgi:hypothetical protein
MNKMKKKFILLTNNNVLEAKDLRCDLSKLKNEVQKREFY